MLLQCNGNISSFMMDGWVIFKERYIYGLLWLLSGQRLCLQCRRPQLDFWVGKIPWRMDRLPTPVFLGFSGDSVSKESTCNVGDLGSIPGLGRCPGGGHGNPLQYSCLENPHGQRCLMGCSPWGCRVRHDWATNTVQHSKAYIYIFHIFLSQLFVDGHFGDFLLKWYIVSIKSLNNKENWNKNITPILTVDKFSMNVSFVHSTRYWR